MDDWREEKILITVRAYPEPSERYIETSCVAGVTEDGRIFRLHPIPARLMAQKDKFSKYDVLRLRVKRSEDPRPESHRVDLDRGFDRVNQLGTKDAWSERNRWVAPFRAKSIEDLAVTDVRTSRSLALVRPREISGLVIERRENNDWPDRKRAKLSRLSLMFPEKDPLEYIPYKFSYKFHCQDDRCCGHKLSIVDWELAQSYRSWSKIYGKDWEAKFREKYERELIERDLQFFVGTMLRHPKTWIIVGLYYPPRLSQMTYIESPSLA